MGQQCYTKLKHVLKHAPFHRVSYEKIHHESGGGEDQNEPWEELCVSVLLLNGAELLFYVSPLDQNDLWFDANEWGNNYWQVEEMRKLGVPYILS